MPVFPRLSTRLIYNCYLNVIFQPASGQLISLSSQPIHLAQPSPTPSPLSRQPSQPSSQPASRQSASQPNQPTSQPASQAGSQLGGEPELANQPASQSGMQPFHEPDVYVHLGVGSQTFVHEPGHACHLFIRHYYCDPVHARGPEHVQASLKCIFVSLAVSHSA